MDEYKKNYPFNLSRLKYYFLYSSLQNPDIVFIRNQYLLFKYFMTIDDLNNILNTRRTYHE